MDCPGPPALERSDLRPAVDDEASVGREFREISVVPTFGKTSKQASASAKPEISSPEFLSQALLFFKKIP